MEKNIEHITITGKDLGTSDKVDTFIDLFGRNELIKAMKEMSVQVHGDGAIEKIDSKIEQLDLSNGDDDDEKYENLRNLRRIECERLVEPEKATYKLPIGLEMDQNVFQKRDIAKKYLGVERFRKIVYPMGESKVDRVNLRQFNPHLKEYEEKKAQVKRKAKELEEQRKEILSKPVE